MYFDPSQADEICLSEAAMEAWSWLCRSWYSAGIAADGAAGGVWLATAGDKVAAVDGPGVGDVVERALHATSVAATSAKPHSQLR